MTIIQAIILGIVQGLTEFLPVSSSAHLALVPYWFNWQLDANEVYLFGILVQMGTLAAVLIYYWKDLIAIIKAFFIGIAHKKPFESEDSRMGWLIILATIPAGLAGLLLEPLVQEAFNTPLLIGICLLITAALLLIAEKVGKKNRTTDSMTWKDALWIGVAQILAIFPGISRSGATITAGLTHDFTRKDASRFSFLMSIPIMLAAGLLSVTDLFSVETLSASFVPLIIAAVAAGIVGFLSIRWMLSYISKKPFTIFSIYCTVAGIFTIILTFIKR